MPATDSLPASIELAVLGVGLGLAEERRSEWDCGGDGLLVATWPYGSVGSSGIT